MKIAIYYTHSETLGHTTRVLNIARYLKNKDADVLILQGGIPQPFVKTRDLNIKNVPYPVYGRERFYSKYYKVNLKIDLEKMKKRLMFIRNAISRFNPDIFITEFFPFGRPEERFGICPFINYLRNKNPSIKIYSSIGYPIFSLKSFRLVDSIIKNSALFDKIFIHTPQIEMEYANKVLKGKYKRKYRKVFNKIDKKIIFTNYIIDNKTIKNKNEIRKKLGLKNKKLILISRGGGATHPKIILNSILSSKYLDENYFLLVCAGPSSTKREMDIFKNIAKNSDNIKIIKFLPNFPDYLNACDVSVNMSGYNTSTQILWTKTKSVVIPRPDEVEQYYRAKMLKDFLGASVINYNDLKPEKIAEEINHQINMNSMRNLHKIKKEWFDGLRFFTEKILNSGED